MDIKEIKKLAHLLSEMGLTEIEIEDAGKRIRIRKEHPPVVQEIRSGQPTYSLQQEVPLKLEEMRPERPPERPKGIVLSPFVGTFYRSPTPMSPPYVEVGNIVEKGQILGVVAAMKLMNEIESPVAGTVVDIYVSDSAAVGYGTELIRIE